MSSVIVYSTRTGVPSPAQHPAIVARIHAATVSRGWVRCRSCGYERKVGEPCGSPCV